MGHKVSPISFRLQVSKDWQSKWFSSKDYASMLHEDINIRKTILSEMGRKAGIAKVEIERNGNQLNLFVHTSRPGVVIGRGGAGATELKNRVAKLTKTKIKDVNIVEVKNPEANAQLIADNIAVQLEKRIPFKRAMRQAVEKATKAGAKGVKVVIGGRLNGAEIARSEKAQKGKIPLATIDANIDYSTARAKTTYGILGIKVWIYTGMQEHQKPVVETEKKEVTDVNA